MFDNRTLSDFSFMSHFTWDDQIRDGGRSYIKVTNTSIQYGVVLPLIITVSRNLLTF